MAKKAMSAKKPARSMYSTDPSKLPSDYLRGSVTPGEKYTAWKTKSGEAPTLGKGKGPGTPYREVIKTQPARRTMSDATPEKPTRTMGGAELNGAIQRRMSANPLRKNRVMYGREDAKTKAIARRLKSV